MTIQKWTEEYPRIERVDAIGLAPADLSLYEPVRASIEWSRDNAVDRIERAPVIPPHTRGIGALLLAVVEAACGIDLLRTASRQKWSFRDLAPNGALCLVLWRTGVNDSSTCR